MCKEGLVSRQTSRRTSTQRRRRCANRPRAPTCHLCARKRPSATCLRARWLSPSEVWWLRARGRLASEQERWRALSWTLDRRKPEGVNRQFCARRQVRFGIELVSAVICALVDRGLAVFPVVAFDEDATSSGVWRGLFEEWLHRAHEP